MKRQQPKLTMVQPSPDDCPMPPRPLGLSGFALWRDVHHQYTIEDAGGVELLYSACEARDRLDQIGQEIARDGVVIRTKHGIKDNPLIRHEVALRAFIVKTIERLGINLEAVKSVGRPGIGFGVS
jgi:hypothetical protein